jgi:protein involved in polysaccharide export with SLBB domain
MRERASISRRHRGGPLLLVVLALLVVPAVVGCGIRVPALAPADVARLAAAGNFPDRVYQLEAGDTVQIRYVFHPEVSQEAIIRPDGKISVAEVGDVAVAGMTTAELERYLIAKTSDRLRNAVVIVSVTRYGEKSVYIGGEVSRPGALPYRRGLTALQAIVAAGGFRDSAKVDSVILIRAAGKDNEFVARKLDLAAVVTAGVKEPLVLAPHDVVFVPRTRIADANIWVRQHIVDLIPIFRGVGASVPLPIAP